ncbi:ribosomal protein S27AE [Methanococcus maripaludis]|uniref:Ribosomal protein S27AE n=1 Tax=Methanococcus maripaludis TaxID=39152 RepID=A0A7J9NX66_METMI|nr:hypothetical protein [Methanococcus maripaludis]MBA2851844.1 ribosomal protein S27AE [Methanococcus maripaludis]
MLKQPQAMLNALYDIVSGKTPKTICFENDEGSVCVPLDNKLWLDYFIHNAMQFRDSPLFYRAPTVFLPPSDNGFSDGSDDIWTNNRYRFGDIAVPAELFALTRLTVGICNYTNAQFVCGNTKKVDYYKTDTLKIEDLVKKDTIPITNCGPGTFTSTTIQLRLTNQATFKSHYDQLKKKCGIYVQ